MLPSISSHELTERMQKGEKLNLLDVRERIEYHTYNIGGINIPLKDLESSIDDLTYNKTDEIIVICKVGLRSGTAAELLKQKGYQKARNLTGGLLALRKLQS
ncbi:rhodanese-like domain-containing protein [Mucilaginibacter sp. L3T2-6]|uniref:rhodanese-like domain-containing protein n=1 Tax=Mucilaginibacter sp. L3T2-6 TaxID=3062491 RepID=UPI0026743E3A|nr:rhodanese-like domain-containing protein [Mucilaginibacter sp. L3T2-6]MDO3641057.1 rhodanese-like domain-containing protein [Mucilaginibacter sp. L3T2-6]MDV6213467.1 rhodanese-like domain-containing protein [Mucilaginibacter sp. L3T2-6]